LIPQSRPNLQASDFKYIRGILNSGQVAQGGLVKQLESAFSKTVGTRGACAVSSGTAALHLALLALGIRPGHEVMIPSYTCAAVWQAVRQSGATPRLIDIDPVTLNITAATIRKKMNPRCKAVVVTHSFGLPADLDEISKLGLPVIEDCALALGAIYKGKPVGSRGIISTFSFYATKMICAGEGGMVCSSNARLLARISDLNHTDMRNNLVPRYNYKMSDLTAGLALSQLGRLPQYLTRRKKIAHRYITALGEKVAWISRTLPGSESNHYRFLVRTSNARRTIQRSERAGIRSDKPVFRPLHSYLHGGGAFAGTDLAFETVVSVPLYPALRESEVQIICNRLPEVLAA
jgi:perosamine synthetase